MRLLSFSIKKIAAQALAIFPPLNLHPVGHMSSLSMDLLQARVEHALISANQRAAATT
jgi:hypothetical protein